MEIILFQIGVFVAIIIIGLFGKKARIGICVFLLIFTMLAVFTSGLMMLQFITIGLGYWASSAMAPKSVPKEHKLKHWSENYNSKADYHFSNYKSVEKENLWDRISGGCAILFYLGLAILTIFAFHYFYYK